jgi:hypothetical protein
MVKPFAFFPTPYPDEIFYSVLCRYHLRNGSPAFVNTSKVLWGQRTGQNLYLPQTLGKISGRIPKKSGLTVERFIIGNTIFPYLKPFLPRERGQRVFELMKSDTVQTEMAHQVSGLPRSKSPKWQYLRYCEDCWKDDIQTYGEPYWHRLHLLPGIFICPVHGKPIRDSRIFLKDVQSKFYPAAFQWTSDEISPIRYSDDTTEKLMAVARDSVWLLQKGDTIGFSDTMIGIYDQLLRVKGYRCLSGRKTKNKELHAALCDFYGREFLKILDAYSEGFIPWSQRMMHNQDSLLYPVYYLLLMRFLAGSTEDFFMKPHDKAHPYGNGPWPCRNPVCSHHLQDVIADIKLIQSCDRHQVTFTCPHCGFSYRRSREKPKSKQYSGQINIVDYGWLWLDTFQKQMAAGVPIMKITEMLHCGFRTAIRLGVEFGFFPEDRMPVRKPYTPKEKAMPEIVQKPNSKAYYRQQWKKAMKANPGASRSRLIKRYPEAYKWLRKNDLAWYEKNAPASKKSTFDWAVMDSEYLKKAMAAVEYLRSLQGKPLWINRRSVEKYAGINNFYRNLSKGYLPKTKTYLDENLETDEEWRMRKICWAVKTLYEEGRTLLLPKIQIKAAISHKMFAPLEEFTLQCIEQIQKTEETIKKQST